MMKNSLIKSSCTGQRSRAHVPGRALLAAGLFLCSSTAWAIPSPDLVINLSASVAQLLGLLSVVFGGVAMSSRKKAKKRNNKGSASTKILLGITAVLLLGAVAANILQYTGSIDAKNQRLQTNLVRKSIENGSAVGDVSLKTLSFSEQGQHPQGIGTDTLSEWLEKEVPINIIDVREDEEFEMGAIDDAAHLRYPDVLAQSSLIPDNSHTVFLCYSGNRSSELCTEFTKQGRSCSFMVGGIEKWMSEGRDLGGTTNLTLDDLRQTPDYPNKAVLLDTPDVHTLVQNEDARFIDVRYPADFIKDHLPGAINITMRALNSAALAERIAALPDKPIIAACYDKRSCFFGQLIGLRITRAGGDFRGRYTVPHEYYVPGQSKVRAHVAAWKASQQQPTLASYVVTPMRSILDKLVELTGHYALGLLAVVLAIRLLLLPLALKADRDTQVQKSLTGRVTALKEELADHPRALTEATMGLYKKYRIRPVINMLASLFQLGLMLLFYSAVSESAANWPHTLAWMESAAAKDPLFVMPILASVLFVGVLWMSSPPKTRVKVLAFSLGGALLFALLQTLGAAVNLYLAISMAFLIGQSLVFRALGEHYGWSTLGEDKTGQIEDTGLVPLSQAHYLPESTGKKAARLGELIEAGYRVPDGFVFTSVITNKSRSDSHEPLLSKVQKKQLGKMWRNLKAKKVAVRSSGANEDGEENSFAGVYESILNVHRGELLGAVRDVYQSLGSERSNAYTSHTGETPADAVTIDQGGVVVQKMVPAEYAGVMFTEHPTTCGAIMVECVSGLAEDLVSGNVTPKTFAFGKVSGDHLIEASGSDDVPRLDLQPLLALGRELEKLFGQPQDIEWAFAKGQFYLLQTRDITRSIAQGDSLKSLAEAERRKLLSHVKDMNTGKPLDETTAGEKVFVQNELSELLPRPTPASADLMEMLWAAGGSTDLACEDLGIPYKVNFFSPPYLTTVFGWTYVNKREESRRLGKGPGAMASFRLARNAEPMAAAFRDEFLPEFQLQMIERNAIDMQRLKIDQAVRLLSQWVERFVTETYRQAELINISADYHTKTALQKLSAAKLEPTLYLNDDEETVVSKAMALLRGNDVSAENVEQFLEAFGHRAPLDYELSEPRFNESPELVQQYISRSVDHHSDKKKAGAAPLPEKKVLAISVKRARDFQRLKEEAKHVCLQELAQIRQLLLALGDKTSMGDAIFQLHLSEMNGLADPVQRDALTGTAASRLAAANTWCDRQLPAALSVSDLERLDMLTGKRPDVTVSGELSGKRVAGEEEVDGTVRVITDISQIESFQQGEILVARMTDPTWYPLFSQARGIITEVGGWLSHAAIVAREYDLPAIVGVPGICAELETGDVVRLKLDGSIERISERRSEQSPMRDTAPAESVLPPMDAELYQLSNGQIANFQLRADRREFKNRLGDRRATPRLTASGTRQPDRRAINRAAFRLVKPSQQKVELLRKAS